MPDWITPLVGWQKSCTAPKDGTPILVSGDGNIGVFYWEDRRQKLGRNQLGQRIKPHWHGVYFQTDLNPAFEATPGQEDVPLDHRIVEVQGLAEPFFWQPLPEQAEHSTS